MKKALFVFATALVLVVCVNVSFTICKEQRSKVYFMKNITPENVVKLFEATGKKLPGRVAVQQSMGEPGGSLFIEPDLSEKLVKQVGGTWVNSTGVSDDVSIRKSIAAEHGFTKSGSVDILDEDAQIEIPVKGGRHLSHNVVGSHIREYDSLLVLTHFKGHAVSGIGGIMKNLSIGMASPAGKR